jgi:predicted dienelactone hydrolase
MGETYNPFARGPFPVGVRTAKVIDDTRQMRTLPFEWWYPATDECCGQDITPSTQDVFSVAAATRALAQCAVRNARVRDGRYPLIVFSHTSNGHRRQATSLCTHLASHGYVVSAVDHVGNTVVEMAERNRRNAEGKPLTEDERAELIQRIIGDRVPDIRCLLNHLLRRLPTHIDVEQIGLVGWSFGGWAVLATPEVDDRIRAVVALAPAGGSNPLPGIIPAKLSFQWRNECPTLFLVAERDQATPLVGMYELFNRTPSPKRMLILCEADHGHFGDQIDAPGHCSPDQAHAFVKSLSLAHFDDVLKGDTDGRAFLSKDLETLLSTRGVKAVLHNSQCLEL